MTPTYLDPVAITGLGMGGTISGALNISKGRVLEGSKGIILGMAATDLGGRLHGLDPISHANLMKGTLCTGTAAAGFQGAFRLARGMAEASILEIIKGTIQTTACIGGTFILHSLKSRAITTGFEVSAMAVSGSLIAKIGLCDLAKGRYRTGLCKVLLGLGGIAGAGYYVYSSYQQQPLPSDLMAFLETHKTEIEGLYEDELSGKWSEFGRGASKKTFAHPDLSGMLIKIPSRANGYRTLTGDGDLRMHHANLEEIRSIASQFDRIALPESHLYSTSKGLAIVEQKMDLFKTTGVDEEKEALDQFYAFKQAAHMCDLAPEMAHNAGLIQQTNPPKIGIIDFDCRSDEQYQINNNRREPFSAIRPHSGSKRINRGRALTFSLTASYLSGALAGAAKKISGIHPKTFLNLAFGVGLAAAPIMMGGTDRYEMSNAVLALSNGIVIGTLTAVASETCSAAAKAFSWLTGSIEDSVRSMSAKFFNAQ